MVDANVTDANTSDANTTDANVTDANTSDANATDANVTDANLPDGAAAAPLDVDPSLVGHYTFENPGALGTDTSPAAGNGGTAIGDATAATDATRGNVLSLSGAGSVQVPGLFGNPANVTLSAWINLTGTNGGNAEVISLGDSVMLRYTGGGIAGWWYNGSFWQSGLWASMAVGSGWHHVAFTFDDPSDTGVIYLDGAVGATRTGITTSITYTQGASSVIGRHGNPPGDYDFTGLIDDVRIYNRVLTATEIATLLAL